MPRTEYLNDPDAPRPNSMVVATTAFLEDHDGRVLLIQRGDSGKWALPGGGLELGETVADSAVRETEEETGYRVEVVGLVGIYSNPRHVIAYSDGEVRQQFSICLRARLLGGEARRSSESVDVGWFGRSELDQLDIHPEMRLRIDRGFAHEPEPYLG